MEQQPTTSTQEQEIDLIELVQKLWKERKYVLKACIVGVIIGLIIAFSIPKEYKTVVKLSPENVEGSKTGQLSGLAAIAGINLGAVSSSDALGVDLYPDIMSSTPFLLELVNVPVETKNGKLKVSFYEYMTKHQKSAWWNYIKVAPFKVLGWGMSLFREKEKEGDGGIDPFRLTNDQENFVNCLRGLLAVGVDKKTGVITASVVMQDPLISAVLMDTVLCNLQSYITDYRTRKAKHDLAFSEKLYSEAKDAYYNAQKKYAAYVDSNKNVISASFRTEEERLRNEMNLAYGVYNQIAQQLDAHKIKVQEVTPVYAVIEPASIPLKALKPNKGMVLIGFTFFAFVLSIAWIFIRELLSQQKINKKDQYKTGLNAK